MNQSAAIFDMDGLLLDTDPKIWLESMQEVAHRHNIPISTELLKFTKGLRIFEVTNFWNEYFGWNDKPKSVRVAEEIIDTVIASAKKSGRVMPGVQALLSALQEHDIPLGVATSSPQRMVHELLQHFNLNQYFTQIHTADNCFMGKPHPEVYLNCAQALGVWSWRCIAFEDSVNGMVAAKAARMSCVLVPTAEQFDNPAFGLAEIKIRSLEQFTYQDYLRLCIH